jgi:hypothetical protein
MHQLHSYPFGIFKLFLPFIRIQEDKYTKQNVKVLLLTVYKRQSWEPDNVPFMYRLKSYAPFINGENETIVLLRDAFHIGLVIGPRPAVLAWGAAVGQYIRSRTYN